MNRSKAGPITETNDRSSNSQGCTVEPDAVEGWAGLRDGWQFGAELQEAAQRAEGRGAPWSLVLVDIDHLKAFNEAFGRLAGDDVVRKVVDLLRTNLPTPGMVTRLGGEEFAVVLPASDAPSAVRVGECLRRAIEEHDWLLRPVTASFGVATQPSDGLGFATWIDRAEKALRRSKCRGYNHVTHADPTVIGDR